MVRLQGEQQNQRQFGPGDTEPARPCRAGVAVFFKIYARCIDDQDDADEHDTTDAPAPKIPTSPPGEGDGDTTQAS